MSRNFIYEARVLGTDTIVYGQLVEGNRRTLIVAKKGPGLPPENIYQVDPDTVKLVTKKGLGAPPENIYQVDPDTIKLVE